MGIFLSFFRDLSALNTLHGKKMDSAKCCRPSLHRESISFMKGVMDECTHMANFSGKCCSEDRYDLFTASVNNIIFICLVFLEDISLFHQASYPLKPRDGASQVFKSKWWLSLLGGWLVVIGSVLIKCNGFPSITYWSQSSHGSFKGMAPSHWYRYQPSG